MSIDQAAFRRAMSQFATGVTVITVRSGERVHGMTANTFTSLSLEPPLILFCVGKQARLAGLLGDDARFAVSVLGAHQEAISRHFAGSQRAELVDRNYLQEGPAAPMVPDALVNLSCVLEAVHDGGDHWIVVGRVFEIHEPSQPRPPLVFFRSRYASLIEPSGTVGEPNDRWANESVLLYHDEWSDRVELDEFDQPAEVHW